MELTEVRINLCGEHGSRLKAFCSLTFDNTFVIRDVNPINAECRQDIERRVLNAYDRELERSRQPGYVPPSLDGEDFELYDERPARPSNGAVAVVTTTVLRPTGAGVR